MIAPSRPSSSDSISILPIELAASASRSSTRATIDALAGTQAATQGVRGERFVVADADRRTLTPLRWLTWLLARARWLNVATTSVR